MLGTALRHALADRRIPTLQLLRSAPAGAHQLQWDPTLDHPISESARLEGCACAIHLSGASIAGRRWTEAYRRELKSSRVDTTRALAAALARLRHPPETLLVASAVGIYGNRGDEVLDESSALGSGFLAELCREWEEAADLAKKAGIRVVPLRFGVVLDTTAGALAKMLPAFRLGLGGRLGSGTQWMSWVSLEDAVNAILFGMDTRSLAGPVNVTSPNPVRNAEFTRVLARTLHRPAILPAPAFALRLVLGAMADEALLAGARAVPARLQAAGFRFTNPHLPSALDAALAQKPRR